MKEKKNKPLIFTFLISFLLLVCIQSSTVADPTVTTISLDPADPAPTETITFTATIDSNETPTSVFIVVQECNENICFKDGYNESMTLQDTGDYQGQIALQRDDVTYIKYHIVILSNGEWYANEIAEFDLTEDDGNGDTNGDNDGNGSTNGDGTPGFELIVFLIAGIIIIISFKHKRSR